MTAKRSIRSMSCTVARHSFRLGHDATTTAYDELLRLADAAGYRCLNRGTSPVVLARDCGALQG